MELISLYFSESGESEKVANYYAKKLSCYSYDLMPKTSKENFSYNKSYDLIILSFPVYSQNIPKPLKDFISKLKSSYFDINITYGKMSFGNCLKDVSRLIN